MGKAIISAPTASPMRILSSGVQHDFLERQAGSAGGGALLLLFLDLPDVSVQDGKNKWLLPGFFQPVFLELEDSPNLIIQCDHIMYRWERVY